MKEKVIIYQVLPRLFGNQNTTCKENGTIEENGCGKLNNFSDEVLARIHDMGFTHIWYTGVIRHATQTNYSSSKAARREELDATPPAMANLFRP